MATGQFFKTWQDVGAPTLTNTAGSLIAILDWALDTAGATYWEKVYTGTNKAVYRSKTGIRPYLRIDDTNAGVGIVRMYQTMSDVDTGTGVCPDGINQNIDGMRWGKSYDAGPNAYYVVGDSEFFLIFTEIDDRYRLSPNSDPMNFRLGGFGEIASYLAVDSWPCVIIGSADTSTTTVQYNALANNPLGSGVGMQWNGYTDQANHGDPNQAHVYFLKTADGVTNSSGACLSRLSARQNTLRMSNENPFLYAPIYINDSYGEVSTSSTRFYSLYGINAVLRARLPYLYVTHLIHGTTYGGPEQEDLITVGASQFMYLYSADGGSSGPDIDNYTALLIRTTNDEPDRP